MRLFRYTLIFTFLISWLHVHADGPNSCRELRSRLFSKDLERGPKLEKGVIFGQEVEYLRFGTELLKKGKLLPASIVDSENAFFIGFAQPSHTYLVANGLRFDGGISSQPKIRGSDNLSEGIVFRIEGDSEGKVLSDIQKYLENNPIEKTITCSEGVCRIIQGGENVVLDTFLIDNILPHRLLKKVLKNALKTSDGQALHVDMLVIGDEPLNEISDEIISESRRMFIGNVTGPIGGGTVGLIPILAGVGIYLYSQD